MWAIIREILGYLIFLWVLVVVSYGNRDPNAFLLKQTLSNEFILNTENGELTTAFLNVSKIIFVLAILKPSKRTA